MSEFKFACPVCGQHITADSASSGTQLQCPTCFQKIIVPQAPASGEAKFILSASQVGKPRPTSAAGADAGTGPIRPNKASVFVTVGLLVALAGAGAAVFAFREKIFKPGAQATEANATTAAKAMKAAAPAKVYPVPTNAAWTLEFANISIPDAPAAGKIHGDGFSVEKATIQGGTLNLRQGAAWPPDLGLTLHLFAQKAEELAGKTVEIAPDRTPPIPKITLRWKDALGQAQTRNIPAGYALKVSFGQAAKGRLSGELYLALPDGDESFVAGTFHADIRRPSPPKAKAPKAPKR